MNEWPYEVSGMTQQEILVAVADDEWQQFRRSLKGKTTTQKLMLLAVRRDEQTERNGMFLPTAERIRIDNYINALLRGGQLVRRNNTIEVQR